MNAIETSLTKPVMMWVHAPDLFISIPSDEYQPYGFEVFRDYEQWTTKILWLYIFKKFMTVDNSIHSGLE